jgi:hypothetical protein
MKSMSTRPTHSTQSSLGYFITVAHLARSHMEAVVVVPGTPAVGLAANLEGSAILVIPSGMLVAW